MNKKMLIPIVLILILIPIGLLVKNSMTTSEPIETVELEEDTVMENETSTEEPIDALGVFSRNTVPTGAYRYILSDSSAMYGAQKRFLSKEDEEVVGTTNDVVGAAWFEPETQDMYLEAEIGLSTLSTGTSGRDNDVQELLTSKIAKIIVTSDSFSNTINLGEEFDVPITAQVTINNVTRDVVFNTQGMIDAETFDVSGAGSINMSEFGIAPPSLANVFTVDDEIELRFQARGEALESTDAMMEEETDTTTEDDATE